MMVSPPAARSARTGFLVLSLWLVTLTSFAQAPAKKAAPPPVPVQALTPFPKQVRLVGRYDEARVLVGGLLKTGVSRDVSAEAQLAVSDPKVATVDETGTIRPRGNGKAVLVARYKQLETRIPVEVRGVLPNAPPRFLKEVMPVLTRTGCNIGSCHGAGQGKGGFKLSLLGYDPEADYEAITRAAGARRISRAQPENSLFLRKPSLGVAHRGGLRFKVNSAEYRLLRDWIAYGLPGPDPKEAHVTRLEVTPALKTLEVGQTQRFLVKAVYSDGSTRDATNQTLFNASEEAVASVTPDGEAKAVGPGEGAVVIRYQSLVATARVISPFALPRVYSPPKAGPTPADSAVVTAARIDDLINRKLAALGLEASGKCSDSDFLRRATLDVTGLLPTPEEARAFLASRDPQKRDKLIASLMERPEYVDFWTMRWGDILRSSRNKLSEKGMYAFNHWLRRSVAENKPWNQFARELILAQGSPLEEGPANFYRTAGSPSELAETTSQVFLGVRIQCAKCHNHPYEKWKLNQYYQMAAFFARVGLKNGEKPGERIVLVSNSGEVNHPKTKQTVSPCALDAAPVPADYRGDRRQALADWLTAPSNPFFAHILVNRVWRHFLGRGLVEPVDDLRATNPPSNPALFDFLAKDFVQHGYDVKRLMRAILLSQAYQRSPIPTKNNARDTKFTSHYAFKRLGAEQLMDAITSATGVAEKFSGYPTGTRATQLPDTTIPSYFLELFGRPARSVACECERSEEPNLGQILHLMNNTGLNERIASKEGRVAQLLNAKAPDSRIVQELYLAAVSRLPSAEEGKKALKALAVAKDKKQAAEDLLWTLMNSTEFIFNH